MPVDDEFGLKRPNVARIWDTWAGGYHNFDPDRAVADAVEAVYPGVHTVVAEARQFTGRVVTWAARQGIGQFIDLGSGYPASPRLHDTARAVLPGARVVHVDHDLVVTSHTDAMLTFDDVAVVEADLTDVAAVLAHPHLTAAVDLAEPVCVLLGMILHFMPASAARRVVAGYAGRIAPGSVVAISVARTDDPVLLERIREAYTVAPLHNHSRDEVAAFLGGLDVVRPGVVVARAWRGGMPDPKLRPDAPLYVLACAGRVASRPGK